MADLIEIGVEVRTNSVRSATKEVDSLGKTLKSAERSASAFVDAFARQERQVSKAAAANKAYSSTAQKMYSEILKIDTATKSASASASVFAANLEKEARAAAQVAKENERLKSKFVEGHTAMNIYTKELNDLAIARKRDIITSKQQKDAVAQLNAQMSAGTGVFAAAGGAMQQTARKTNQLGVLMQQSGYQVGDFAVQVQSGTNFMVAFGQQATQLIGTFAMLAKSTRMIALFSGLGVLLPILTALGAYFIRAKDSAVDSAKGIEDAFSGLSSYFEDLSVSISDSFDDAFNNIEEKYGQLFTRLAKIKLDQTKASLTESFTSEIAPIESPSFMERLGAALAPGMVMGSSSAALEAQEAVEKSTEEVYKLSRAIAEVEARYIASVNAAASLNDIIDITTKTEAELALISEEAANAFALQAEAAGITVKIQEQLNDSQEKSYKRFDAHTVAWQKHQDKVANANTDAQQELDLLVQKNILLDLELQYGKESSVYKEVALGFEEDNLRKKLEAKGVDEAIISGQIEALRIQGLITGELADQLSLKKLQAQFEQKPMGGRGGDPRNQGGSFIDWNTIEATKFLKDYEKNLKKVTKAEEDADKAAEALRKELEAPMVKAIDSVSNAFGDFIANGLKDFKSFASSIVNSFKSMIAQMIATAARNKIMLSLGMGGTAFAEQAVAGQVAGVGANTFFGGPIGSAVGSFAGGGVAGSGFLGGLGAAGSSAMAGYASGGLAGGASGLFSVGANAAAAGGGMMATLGAAVPVIGAVALAVGFLSKKVKVLDEGARFSANGLDVLGESMKKLKTTRFFGLSKKTSTEYEASDPLTQALEGQLSVVKSLARQLDFSTDALKDFTYEVEFSTKGLSEAEIAEKYALELRKFGDAAAGAIANGAGIADLMALADAPRRRLAELLQSDPLVGYNIEVMQQSVKASMKEFKKAFESMPEVISENMDQAVGSVSAGFGAIASAADVVRDYLYTTLGNLNEILGYSAGGPMGNLSRIGDTLDRIFAPAEKALDRLTDAYTDQVQVYNEVVKSGTATTEELQKMSSAMSNASRAIGEARLPISTIRGGYGILSSAISDFFSKEIEDALELSFPDAAKNLGAFTKGIIGTVSEGSVAAFESAFVNLADAFGEGEITAERFNTAMDVLNEVFRGNISLTDEYTATQQKAVDKLSSAFNTLKDNLEGVISTIETAMETLTSARQDAVGTLRTREQSLSYLRDIAATGQIPTGDQSSFNAAVQAVSNIETTGFRTATEMLRYIGQTSGVLSSIQSQAEQQLTDAEVQVKAILKIQDTNETSAEALVSIDSAIKEFLGAGGRIPQFASGGYHSGGLRIVGENGPELEATGPSRIIPNNRISVGSDSELRREVAEMRVDLKSALVQIAKNTRKSSDTLNKFDYQGLPATRGY